MIGRATGLLSLVMLVFSLATPPAFGLIYDRTGSYDAVFLVLAVLAAATLIPVPFIRMHPRSVPAGGADIGGANRAEAAIEVDEPVLSPAQANR